MTTPENPGERFASRWILDLSSGIYREEFRVVLDRIGEK
jgi:hypothetical protein